jgi:hypothetical protein
MSTIQGKIRCLTEAASIGENIYQSKEFIVKLSGRMKKRKHILSIIL